MRKLLDKSARTDNQHEADVFARKAAELVARHRIDPDRLTARRFGELELIEIEVGRGAYVRGRLALLHDVADAHDVRTVFRSTPVGAVAMLAGHRDDLDVVEVMYASLHAQVAGQMAEIKRSTGAATQRDRRAFLFGFADRIGELLRDARTTIEDSAAAPHARRGRHGDDESPTTVALRERRARVDEFAEREWGRVRAASRPTAVTADGYRRGKSAADRADVGRRRLRGHRELGAGE
ncbi:DUF2786 domain-containing protein [Ilumatobacter sp.]|uniref:DUF2786 domain-containing protein n=1 Tax=Ilumatobacter sp. TaxID=1967498 RepID=UPI003B52CD0D